MKAGPLIVEVAGRLLEKDPDPVPRLRILRDILDRPEGDAELAEAREALLRSRWVAELAEEQCAHGGWARFHSMDTRVRRRIPTTEAAVRRAVQLGLTPGDEILARAETYLERLLSGAEPWPEHEEPNDRWPAGQEMFVAATLGEIQPRHALLEPVCRKWSQIAERAFETGRYEPEGELSAHRELTGATTMRDSYLVLDNRYALALLGSRERQLSDRAERALVEWVWNDRGRLRYLDAPVAEPVDRLRQTEVERWFASQAILSPFRSWPAMIDRTVRRLWDMRSADGVWDLGPTTGRRLSESWRRRANRSIDHSVEVLLLLKAFHDARRTPRPS